MFRRQRKSQQPEKPVNLGALAAASAIGNALNSTRTSVDHSKLPKYNSGFWSTSRKESPTNSMVRNTRSAGSNNSSRNNSLTQNNSRNNSLRQKNAANSPQQPIKRHTLRYNSMSATKNSERANSFKTNMHSSNNGQIRTNSASSTNSDYQKQLERSNKNIVDAQTTFRDFGGPQTNGIIHPQEQFNYNTSTSSRRSPAPSPQQHQLSQRKMTTKYIPGPNGLVAIEVPVETPSNSTRRQLRRSASAMSSLNVHSNPLRMRSPRDPQPRANSLQQRNNSSPLHRKNNSRHSSLVSNSQLASSRNNSMRLSYLNKDEKKLHIQEQKSPVETPHKTIQRQRINESPLKHRQHQKERQNIKQEEKQQEKQLEEELEQKRWMERIDMVPEIVDETESSPQEEFFDVQQPLIETFVKEETEEELDEDTKKGVKEKSKLASEVKEDTSSDLLLHTPAKEDKLKEVAAKLTPRDRTSFITDQDIEKLLSESIELEQKILEIENAANAKSSPKRDHEEELTRIAEKLIAQAELEAQVETNAEKKSEDLITSRGNDAENQEVSVATSIKNSDSVKTTDSPDIHLSKKLDQTSESSTETNTSDKSSAAKLEDVNSTDTNVSEQHSLNTMEEAFAESLHDTDTLQQDEVPNKEHKPNDDQSLILASNNDDNNSITNAEVFHSARELTPYSDNMQPEEKAPRIAEIVQPKPQVASEPVAAPSSSNFAQHLRSVSPYLNEVSKKKQKNLSLNNPPNKLEKVASPVRSAMKKSSAGTSGSSHAYQDDDVSPATEAYLSLTTAENTRLNAQMGGQETLTRSASTVKRACARPKSMANGKLPSRQQQVNGQKRANKNSVVRNSMIEDQALPSNFAGGNRSNNKKTISPSPPSRAPNRPLHAKAQKTPSSNEESAINRTTFANSALYPKEPPTRKSSFEKVRQKDPSMGFTSMSLRDSNKQTENSSVAQNNTTPILNSLNGEWKSRFKDSDSEDDTYMKNEATTTKPAAGKGLSGFSLFKPRSRNSEQLYSPPKPSYSASDSAKTEAQHRSASANIEDRSNRNNSLNNKWSKMSLRSVSTGNGTSQAPMDSDKTRTSSSANAGMQSQTRLTMRSNLDNTNSNFNPNEKPKTIGTKLKKIFGRKKET